MKKHDEESDKMKKDFMKSNGGNMKQFLDEYLNSRKEYHKNGILSSKVKFS